MQCHNVSLQTGGIFRGCVFYANSDVMMDFGDASSTCSMYGGSLQTLFSDYDMELLIFTPISHWKGGNITDYIWLEALNKNTTDCVAMDTSSHFWEERDCDEKIARGVVCKTQFKELGSTKRRGFDERYFHRNISLDGYVFSDVMFSQHIRSLENCIIYCQVRIECKAVVWTSNNICHGYNRIISNTEIKIPSPEARVFSRE
ncbi:uncharacterized protein LOC134234541 [Saccostrea cucullata]|uniref:uncharacterized protein LOC134234541 n=1 Tax=Saccostrea cuccullata TaxID=36930 RepID=UPI002ED1A825